MTRAKVVPFQRRGMSSRWLAYPAQHRSRTQLPAWYRSTRRAYQGLALSWWKRFVAWCWHVLTGGSR